MRERLSLTDVHRLTGISRAQISNIETGKVDPKMSTVVGLLTCYGASLSDLEMSPTATVDLSTLIEEGAAASRRLERSGIGPSDPVARLDRKASLGIDVTVESEALASRS